MELLNPLPQNVGGCCWYDQDHIWVIIYIPLVLQWPLTFSQLPVSLNKNPEQNTQFYFVFLLEIPYHEKFCSNIPKLSLQEEVRKRERRVWKERYKKMSQSFYKEPWEEKDNTDKYRYQSWLKWLRGAQSMSHKNGTYSLGSAEGHWRWVSISPFQQNQESSKELDRKPRKCGRDGGEGGVDTVKQ